MIEVVFGDSACGSLKTAQSYGKGKYSGGCVGVMLTTQDGSKPKKADVKAAQKAAEEKARQAWENATPMGGNAQDVFGFNLALSIGDISPDGFCQKRIQTVNDLYGIFPGDDVDFTSKLDSNLKSILTRAAAVESVRIWYSQQPDEMCGLYWMMSELIKLGSLGDVYAVCLPAYEIVGETVTCKTSWGELSPGEWYRYTNYAVCTTPTFRSMCASNWRTLQAENAPLRAVLNGQLASVADDIYDSFILRELAKQPDEFFEASLIGSVLGRYQLGIGDAWIAKRIDMMIQAGRLTVTSEAPKDRPDYHRWLKQNTQ